MPKVFVANNAGHNYSKAEEFGELIYLTQGAVNIHKEVDRLTEKLTNLIKVADKESDFLLLSGNNLLCILAFDIWKSLHGKCKVLHWNPQYGARKYDLYVR